MRKPIYVNLIRQRREEMGLSVERVALLAELTRQTVYDAEKGHGVFLSTARKIAAVLETTVDDLWPTFEQAS